MLTGATILPALDKELKRGGQVPVIRKSVEIDAPPDKVFVVLDDPERI